MSITHTGTQMPPNNMTSATEVFTNYTQDKEITNLLLDFLSHREENGKHTSAATARTLTKDITTLSGGNRKIAVAIIEKALRRGWYSFYDLTHKEKEALHTLTDTGETDRRAVYNMRLEIAEKVLKDATGERTYKPSQKEWCQLELGATAAPVIMEEIADGVRVEDVTSTRFMLEKAYWWATYRLGIVGAGKTVDDVKAIYEGYVEREKKYWELKSAYRA